MPTLIFFIFGQKAWTFEKSRFFEEIQIFFLKLPVESVRPKMSPEIFFMVQGSWFIYSFRPPKMRDKEIAQKR